MMERTSLRRGLPLLLILLVQVLSGCRAALGSPSLLRRSLTSRRLQEVPSNDDFLNEPQLDDDGASRRLLIHPFDVTLVGTSDDFTASDLNALYKVMDQVVTDYIVGTKGTANVDYVLLGDIHSSLASADGETVLSLNTGALKMSQASETLTDETVLNAWVAEAINANYVTALQATPYAYVTGAKYSAEGAAMDDDTGATDDTGGTDDTEGGTTEDDKTISGIGGEAATPTGGSNAGIVAGLCVASLALVALIAVLILRKEKGKKGDYIEQHNSRDDSIFPEPSQEDLDIFVPVGNKDAAEKTKAGPPSSLDVALAQMRPPIVSNPSGLSASSASTDHSGHSPAMQIVTGKPGILGAVPMVLDDGKSLDGNESDFTVNTEAGDSTAVKSVSVPAQRTHRPADVFVNLHERESFERDRQVCIRKDMITSTWAGQARQPLPPQSDSVLQPSHVTASQARQERRSPRDNDMLVFEQAHYESSSGHGRVPPSQVSRMSRNGDVR